MTGHELLVVVNGRPAPQGSKKAFVVAGRARLLESSRAVGPWREAIRAQVQHAIGLDAPTFPTGPVHVELTFRVARPAAHLSTRGGPKPSAPTWVAVRPDLDKYVRAALDGLVDGGAFRDDAQVAQLVARKAYSEPAGAAIRVRSLVGVGL